MCPSNGSLLELKWIHLQLELSQYIAGYCHTGTSNSMPDSTTVSPCKQGVCDGEAASLDAIVHVGITPAG